MHRTSFLSRQRDVIASFSFGAWSVQTFFLQYIYLLPQVLSSLCLPPDRKEELAGTLWPCSTLTSNVLDVGDNPCVKKLDCQICKVFTPAQVRQRATSTYKSRKECGEQKKSSEVSSDATPTLMDPSEVTLLGRVNTDKPSSAPKKKKCSDGSPRSSKRRHSSKPISNDLKSLDDKWSERFSLLEALLLNKSFAVLVRPVNPSAVVTREHPFFDPGASSSVMSTGLVTEGTGSSLVQTSGEAAQLTATQPLLGVPGTNAVQDVSKSATRPVQGPGTSDVATQPLQAPGAEIATSLYRLPVQGQPPQAPGAGPEVLPTGCDATQLDQSLSGGRRITWAHIH